MTHVTAVDGELLHLECKGPVVFVVDGDEPHLRHGRTAVAGPRGRLAARARRFDEHLEIGLGLPLANEFIQSLRPQMRIELILAPLVGLYQTIVHLASSFRPSRIRVSVAASSPASRIAADTAAPAWD